MVEKFKHIKFLKKLILIQLLFSVIVLGTAIAFFETGDIKTIWFTCIALTCVLSCAESMILFNFFRTEEKICKTIMKRRQIQADKQKIMQMNADLRARDQKVESDKRVADSWNEFFKLDGFATSVAHSTSQSIIQN